MDSTNPLPQMAGSSSQREVIFNADIDMVSPSAFGARNATTSSGLTWGYIGGRFGSVLVAAGTLALTASTTNYIVANRNTGAISVATNTTNWNNTAGFIRLYLVVTGTSTVTSWEDHRQVLGGASSSASASASSPAPESLIDQFRAPQQSAELFTLPNGVNEFDLWFDSGTYYLAYDNKTETRLRSASTIAGLSSAGDTTPVALGRYPAIYFDGATWHLWVFIQAGLVTRHYTASTFTGTYTLSDSWPANYADPDVRRSPIDGRYYGAYKNTGVSPQTVGVMVADNLAGPWTDLGAVFADIGRVPWHATEEADPGCIFYGGRAFVAFAGWDGTQQRLGLVEVHPATMRAFAPAAVILNPLETWQQRNSQLKVFSPTFLALPNEPGRPRLYYSHNVSASGIAAGWGFLEATPPPPDGRRPQDVMRFDSATAMDVATGIRATLHGTPTLGDNSMVLGAGPAGAYGYSARQALDDFTMVVEFTPTVLPTGGNFALLCRVSTNNSAVNPIAALWIQGTGARIYTEVKNNAGSGNFSQAGATTTITVGVRYRAVLRKYGTDVRVFINTVQEFSGTHSGSLTGLTEWTLGNQRGITQGNAQQFQGTIHRAFIVAEALPINRC